MYVKKNLNCLACYFLLGITCADCWGIWKAPGCPLVELSIENTSAGCPAIRRHKVRRGDPTTSWQSAICLTVSTKNCMANMTEIYFPNKGSIRKDCTTREKKKLFSSGVKYHHGIKHNFREFGLWPVHQVGKQEQAQVPTVVLLVHIVKPPSFCQRQEDFVPQKPLPRLESKLVKGT